MKKALKMTSALLSLALFGSVAFSACENSGDQKLPTYTVTVSANEGGTLTASEEKVTEGGTVVFTVSPQNGYVLESLTLNGGEVEVSDNTFTVKGVLRDFNAVAKFATPNVTVEFDSAGGEAVADEARLYGGEFGKLPVPIKANSRFLGWKLDGKGDYITQFTTVEKYGTLKLVAAWETIAEEEKELLKPFSQTCVYHDQAATKYGVVWHTLVAPAASVIQIVEGNSDDFTAARTIQADSEAWLTEYISSVVIDELKFSTEYSVRFGDIAADVWSDTYHFTTREETIKDFEFFYVSDTQETYLIESHPESTYIGEKTYFSYVLKDAEARFGETEFIVHGGDIVNYGAETEQWRDMMTSLEDNLFSMPMQAIAGNHEDSNWYSAGHPTVSKMFYFDTPEGQNILAGNFYSYDYGYAHFVNILTNDAFNNKGHIGKKQLEWLKQDLTAARQNPNVKWIIAVMHEGIYTPSATPTALASNYHNKEFGEDLNPIFDEFDVDLVMYGHHHLYLNTFPLVCDETQTEIINKVNGVSPVTTETRYVEHDGVQVAEFVYPEGTTDKGTVHFEIGPAGHQYTSSSWSWLSLANLEENIAKYKRFRMLLSAGARPDDGLEKGRSMYAYVEVEEDELIVRTYMVDVKAQSQNLSLDNGKYLDGFKLSK